MPHTQSLSLSPSLRLSMRVYTLKSHILQWQCPPCLPMGTTEAVLQLRICVRYSKWVNLTSIGASWWELTFTSWHAGFLGLGFHQKVSFSVLVRSMIPLRKGMRCQCIWTPLALLLAPLKTVCMMSGFRPILSGSRFDEKAPTLWCKHYLFGSN